MLKCFVNRHVTVLALSLVLINLNHAFASETANHAIHQHYIAPRAMGMGNTFSGIDDFNVILYNPAGLAHLENGRFNFGIGAGVDKDAIDFAKDLGDVADSNDTDAAKTQAISDLLQSKYGEVYSMRAPRMNFIYTRPRWGIAFIPVDLSVVMMPNQATGPALDVTAYQDTTLAFGWSKKSNSKNFSWGFVGKAIYRGYVDRNFLAIDLIDDGDVVRDEDFKEGFTVDADVGVMWSPYANKTTGPFRKVKPTFSAVLRNIADYGFTSNFKIFNENSQEPDKLHRRLDLGSRWDFPKFSVFEPRVMIDVRDILHENWTLNKGMHVGLELKYNVGSALNGSIQAGLNQMHWTAGLGLQTFFFKLEAVTYAEEYGTSSYERESRVYMAQVNFNF